MNMSDERKIAVVTGGAGFVGSHLCERLLNEGYRVISLDNYFTGSKENHVDGVEYREGHTKDIATHIPEDPDIIYHLGEYARTEESMNEPDVVWEHNIAGTFGILEFWRTHGCKLVYAGSSTKFADGGMGRDQSPYAWSKAANTELVRNYGEWYGLPFAITYFYNVYGPRERAGTYGTVVQIFKEQYLAGKPLTVRSPGTQERIFTHVSDIVDGLVLIGEKGKGDEFGLGAQEAYSIKAIAEMFGAPITMLPNRAGNRMSAKLDPTKSHALGWHATRKIQDYINDIVTSRS